MKLLQLLPVGRLEGGLVQELGSAMADLLNVPFQVLSPGLDPDFAFHGERQQYHSSEILQKINSQVDTGTWRTLGVTSVDLYIPILTFVFGEAQMGGPCAVVSTHRLQQEFYGLPPEPQLLRDRLLKEAIHEIGHTLHLTHCDDYRCVMAPAHAVEWIDIKEVWLCSKCQSRVMAGEVT
jgi:archaemetzincin